MKRDFKCCAYTVVSVTFYLFLPGLELKPGFYDSVLSTKTRYRLELIPYILVVIYLNINLISTYTYCI